jgi:hypothetical protein
MEDPKLNALLKTYFKLLAKENKNSAGVGNNTLSEQIDKIEAEIIKLKTKNQELEYKYEQAEI